MSHEPKLIASFPDGGPPHIVCDGEEVDPRPSAEYLANLISERDEALATIARLNTELDRLTAERNGLKAMVHNLDSLRTRAIDHNATLQQRVNDERDRCSKMYKAGWNDAINAMYTLKNKDQN